MIDAMLERIKHEKTVDIYGHVTCLRAQRNYMVQTEDQYIFIHDALLEAVQSGNTEIPARNLYAHIQKLTQPDPGETVTGMELEFKKLANVKANPSRFVSANLPVNKFKNRLVNILPCKFVIIHWLCVFCFKTIILIPVIKSCTLIYYGNEHIYSNTEPMC